LFHKVRGTSGNGKNGSLSLPDGKRDMIYNQEEAQVLPCAEQL